MQHEFSETLTHSPNTKWNAKKSDEKVGRCNGENVEVRLALQLFVPANYVNHHRISNYAAAKQAKVNSSEHDLYSQQEYFRHSDLVYPATETD